MFVDPVFEAIAGYKAEHQGDVIRFELAIRAEIARIQQYRRHAYTEKNQKHLIAIENSIIENLNEVLKLIPPYLNSAFNEELKNTNIFDRKTLKANCLSWKYTFYHTERAASTKELAELLQDKAKVTIKQVKESAN